MRGEKKEKEGEIYLLAARADKIIRQKMPGVDETRRKERMREGKEAGKRESRSLR